MAPFNFPASVFVAAASLAVALAHPAHAQDTDAPTSRCASIEVQQVRAQQGFLMVAAYATEADFGRQAMTSLRLPAGEATMRFQLCGLAGAETALTLYQDLDSDGRMGRNLLGMPTEPWGASGSPGMMGPSWASARMPLNGQVLVVRMSQ